LATQRHQSPQREPARPPLCPTTSSPPSNDEAVTEAGKPTYKLSDLWQNTYDNSDVTRTYDWGYLAYRYMTEKHPADIQAILAKFRTGDYAGAHAIYNTGIGTRYDADFDAWLTALAFSVPHLGPIHSAGNPGKCIGAMDANKVVITDCDGSPEQNWTVAADGSLHINGLCMDVTNGHPVSPVQRRAVLLRHRQTQPAVGFSA